ncbi:outer membrane biogenesis protein BamB [Botrimarina colliarenosi]|uniref:Outer membrane biogenesis protein BamB n=1 Tax=Botrimarina colliarenosi TaxID=2528001 RepID=A0A5C6AL81_9BACT|nr:PQQ-binding-like beta-propeller repeat protein [Botrimarina colliarenosi]TWU00410.1 outer membrane biogenesis protein BamB [Botrimarina colliarenosi]
MSRRARSAALVAVLLLSGSLAGADDWPQWRGPQRDGVWREEGLAATLPDEGLDYAWRTPVNLGYAGPAVAEGKVYLFEYERTDGEITDQPGARDKLKGIERVRCLDATSGDEVWRHEYERDYDISYPGGPRCTPTVDGDHVYTLGPEGDLRCLRTSDGTVVWSKFFPDDYQAPTPLWGHSAHPLVDGDTLYCLVGGDGSVVVAFNKLTGEDKWRALSTPSMKNEVGYCPPMMIEHNGAKQLVVFDPEATCGLDPATGETLWSVPILSSYGMSIAQPLPMGDRLFVTGYGGPSVFFQLPAKGAEPKILWSGEAKTSASAANASPIADADGRVIYAVDANSSSLVAIDPANGERHWESQLPTRGKAERRSRARHGTVFVIRQGESDRYWLTSETGDLILARLTPEAYEEIARQPLLEPTGNAFGRPVLWSHPAFAERSVFARNDKEIVRVNLAAE